jgi:uncharacterized protein
MQFCIYTDLYIHLPKFNQMRNITGPPVEGEDFFGREKELEYAWSRIADGNNLTLPAPRRVGKTSFALKLIAKAKSEGWNTITINLERIPTEQEFIELFIEGLKELSWWEKVKDKGAAVISFLGKFKPSVSYGGATVELNWIDAKETVYKQLSDLLNHEEKTLIFLDELTVLLTSIVQGENGKKNVTRFLHWLRDIRIRSGSKIRWVFCSSVGIENFTHRHGISVTVNDIPDFKLKSYTKEESLHMLKSLGASNSLQLDEQILRTIVDKLGYCLPYFVQLIFEKIRYLIVVEHLLPDIDIVDTAYNALIEEKHFNTWIERIHEQYGDNRVHAIRLLKHLCQDKNGIKREALVNVLVNPTLDSEKAEEIVSILLYMLDNDGYILDDEGGFYRFRSPLLRDFWFNRYMK